MSIYYILYIEYDHIYYLIYYIEDIYVSIYYIELISTKKSKVMQWG